MNEPTGTGYKVGEWVSVPVPGKRLPWWKRLLGFEPEPATARVFRITAITETSLTVEEAELEE